MTDVLRGLRLRLQMSKWLWMFRWKPWFDAIDLVHDFIDRQVDRAYQERAEKDKGNDAAQKDSSFGVELKPERTDLLWSMVGNVPEDRERLRSEMLLLFVPNNDTTSIFISNVFWNLARFPDVYAKVREEVLSLGEDTRLTYEVLRSMKYLEGVLNESEINFNPSQTLRKLTIMQHTDYIRTALCKSAIVSGTRLCHLAVARTVSRPCL